MAGLLALTLLGVGATLAVTPAAAQESTDDRFQDTQEFSHGDDGLLIEYTIENPEIADEVNVFHDDQFVRVETDDFRFVEAHNDYWEPIEGVDSPTMTVTVDVENDGPYGHFDRYTLRHLPYDLSVNAYDESGDLLLQNTTNRAPEGLIAGNGVLFVGEHETATAQTEHATIRVVYLPGEPPTDGAQAVADALAAQSEAMRAGEVDKDVTSFALAPSANQFPRPGATLGPDAHFAHPTRGLYEAGNTWMHEYAHNTEQVDPPFGDQTFSWFSEGYAEYASYLYALETGHADFQDFRTSLGSGVTEPSVLTDVETWGGSYLDDDDPRLQNDYHQGARVLGALDRQIRATNESATLQDVVRELHDAEDVNHERFLEAVENHSNATVANRTDVWLTSDDPADLPDTWSYAEHNETFGPAPRLAAETDTLRVASPRGDRELTRHGAARVDETVVAEATFENDGDAPLEVHRQLELERRSTSEVTTVSGTATVDPNEHETITLRAQFDEAGERYEVRSGASNPLLEIVDADARIVRAGDTADVPADATTVEPGTSELVFEGFDYGTTVTVSTTDGEEVGSDTTYIRNLASPVDLADLEDGTRYEVTFDNDTRTDTQYLTRLEPVEGTYPNDANGDGLHRDFDRDGEVTDADVDRFFETQHRSSVDDYPEAYDYNGDGSVDLADVYALDDYAESSS